MMRGIIFRSIVKAFVAISSFVFCSPQAFAIDIDQMHCQVRKILHFEVDTVNIGSHKGKGPVPLCKKCLYPQVVAGATTTIFARSAVQPSLAVNPEDCKFMVACWQQGRISNGGALEAEIAYSSNGGKNWKRTTVPLQRCIGGINQRISNMWLSYSADGCTLYLSALAFNATHKSKTKKQNNVVVSISKDNGKTWSSPTYLFTSQSSLDEPTGQFPIPEKTAVTADPNHDHHAYVVYDVFNNALSSHSNTLFNFTANRGVSWSKHAVIYDPFPDLVNTNLSNGIYNDSSTTNNIIVVQPIDHSYMSPKEQGDLLNFMVRVYAAPGATDNQYVNDVFPFQYTLFDIAFIRSHDLGTTWDTAATVVTAFKTAPVFTGGYTYSGSNITGGVGDLMRTGDLSPSYNVNSRNGNLYVAYQTSVFNLQQLPQIGLTASYDGGNTWTNTSQVSRTPINALNPQAFTPFVAITKDGYVGVLYFDFRNDDLSDPNSTLMDAWLAIYKEVGDPHGGSTQIGLDFVKEIRLSRCSYIAQNGPETTLGIMTDGDYPFLVAGHSSFYACYIKSKEGHFFLPAIVIDAMGAELLLDDNYRTAPYFTRVKF